MRSKLLSNLETADLCRELALLLHSGVGVGDGLFLLAEEEKEPLLHELLDGMAKAVDQGGMLSRAFEESGCFPVYLTGLLRVGEEVGKLEETLNALSAYYENKERTERQVISSLTYPAILLVLMLSVIVILLSKVLPVFNDIYLSLGGRLTGIAGGLLTLGQFLDRAMPYLCGILAAVLLFLALFSLHGGFRKWISGLWQKHWGDSGISRKMNNARFAQALAMGFSSGMPIEDAAEMAADLLDNVPKAKQRCAQCREQLLNGTELSKALEESHLLSPAAGRLLTLALRSGNGDTVMHDIARRMQEEASHALESLVSKLEPALVLITSGMVGVILLSVMLPLMNIMSSIG